METKKDLYQDKVDAKLKQLKAQIDMQLAQFDETKADLGLNLKEEFEKLSDRQESLMGKLEEVRNSGQEAWIDMQSGLDEAVDDLEESYKRTAEKVKEAVQ